MSSTYRITWSKASLLSVWGRIRSRFETFNFEVCGSHSPKPPPLILGSISRTQKCWDLGEFVGDFLKFSESSLKFHRASENFQGRVKIQIIADFAFYKSSQILDLGQGWSRFENPEMLGFGGICRWFFKISKVELKISGSVWKFPRAR